MKETIIPLFAFLEQVRKEPDKLSVEARIRHFASIYSQMSSTDVTKQATRCLDCGNPYCQWQCPVHNHIPHWLKLVAEGRILEAADLAHQTNTLPEVCGQVCPQEKLCEGSCTLNNNLVGAVTIGAIENYLTETALNQGWKPDLSQVKAKPYRVAIIGAGPAGLACADRLTRDGIACTVYDKHPEIGGLLTFGIPEFKLEKKIIQRRRALFEEMGIRFQLNTGIDHKAQVDKLLEDYDALFLAMGADKGFGANIANEDLPGVYPALPFLIEQAYYNLQLHSASQLDFTGKKVFVLGAGDTAMDCCRTAVRLGAESVTCVYRRTELERNGVKKDFKNAIDEGVQFVWQEQAVSFRGDKQLEAIEFAATAIDKQGKLHLSVGTHLKQADVALIAYGFAANPVSWLAAQSIALKTNGLVQVNEEKPFPLQTTHPNIFAGGDMVLGANLVVNAIAQGHQAAHSIAQYLDSKQTIHLD